MPDDIIRNDSHQALREWPWCLPDWCDYSPYIVDLIYAKVDENTTNVNDDVTLFGVNIAYAWQSQAALTEVYFFGSDLEPNSVQRLQDENSHTYVVGARMSNQLTDNFSLGLEGAYQGGDVRIGNTLLGPTPTHKKSTQPLVSHINLPIDLERAKNEMPNPDKPELRIEELWIIIMK